MTKPKFALLYLGTSIVFLFLLSINVIYHRVNEKKVLGYENGTKLERAIRAQGNFIEYAPMINIAIFALEMCGLSAMIVSIIGSLFIIGRLFHFSSIMFIEQMHHTTLFREIGMMFTFTALLI